MQKSRWYKSRASAVRAARRACCKALQSAIYMAAEGPDYEIHPGRSNYDDWLADDEFFYVLRGPAAETVNGHTDQT